VTRKDLITTTLAIALIIAAGWAGTRYLRSRQQQAAATAVVPSAGGTVRLLSNPATMPAFTVRDLEGRPVSSDTFHGKVLIVNFWATWCPPCRAEIPDLIALQQKYRDQVQVIGISQDEDGPDVVRKFVADQRMNYPVAMSTPEMEKAFPGIYALPTSFIVSPDGKIASVFSTSDDKISPADHVQKSLAAVQQLAGK